MGKRAALMIGNSEYQFTPRLPNPKNDASDLAAEFAIDGYKDVESLRCEGEQLTILDGAPSHLARRLDIVAHYGARQPPIHAFVQ
jgi:hypothetical protein